MNINFDDIVGRIGTVVLGKADQIRMALTCLFAGGHLLIEDIPGIGKTTLAKVLSRCLGLEFRRIQCTNDMLPGDILGVSIFDRQSGAFAFHPGPIFTQVLLADEINRATPKTQSALLEAMEERQVTSDGRTRPLAHPFFVIATQNPIEQAGTFPLPESQLDRFLMRISLGYPERGAEIELLRQAETRPSADTLPAFLAAADVLAVQAAVAGVHASAALLDYVTDLLEFSRQSGHFAMGLSPRAGLALLKAGRSRALIQGRDHVIPEDIQDVLPAVAGHRLRGREDFCEIEPGRLDQIFRKVPVP
jgi:MoxR-like ATPase